MSFTVTQPAECRDGMPERAVTPEPQLELAELRSRLATEIEARERIQKSLDLRNAALDAATTYFMIVDAKQTHRPIVYVNRAFATQHGFEGPHELVGKGVAVLLEKYATSDRREDYRSALLEGRRARAELDFITADGSACWVGLSAFPIPNEAGEVTHHVTLGADITARLEEDRKKRALQEQLYSEMKERERMSIELRLAQKLESVGRLAAGLAHEINTPIQYVGDSVHFLKSAFDELSKLFTAYRDAVADHAGGPAGEQTLANLQTLEMSSDFEFLSVEVPKALRRTLQGADRVAGIVRAMKEFAHPDANQQGPADLNNALTTTLTVARSEYRYTAAVKTDLADLPSVVCNVGELNQVFLNLIVNAAHAIADAGKDPETGLIQIATRLVEDHVEVEIGDNGCGIAQANVEKIFDPFFTTKEVGRGTGQGLAIARAIVVDKHAGSIDVRSDVGIGTRFIIRLPITGAPKTGSA